MSTPEIQLTVSGPLSGAFTFLASYPDTRLIAVGVVVGDQLRGAIIATRIAVSELDEVITTAEGLGFTVKDHRVFLTPEDGLTAEFDTEEAGPLSLNFLNLSAVPLPGQLHDSCIWNFGDMGNPNIPQSNEQNPTHTYAAPGTYRVTLTAIDTSFRIVQVTRDVTV